MAQPTCPQLLAALNDACVSAAFGAEAKKAALDKLRSMREAKTTWIGDKENALRFEIDRHLRHYGADQ